MPNNFLLEWDFTVQPYTQPETIEISANCFAFMAVNVGAVGSPVATINGFPINAPLAANTNGEAFQLANIEGTVKRKTVDLAFPNGTANVRVIIIQAFYINV
jgi:hypothetical protein